MLVCDVLLDCGFCTLFTCPANYPYMSLYAKWLCKPGFGHLAEDSAFQNLCLKVAR